jgi:serine protease inhibitor
MDLPFTKAADFSGIDGSKDLFISFVVHKAYVDVTETGTTAAGATGVGTKISIGAITIPLNPPVPFVADHPFIFMIVENTTNTVLFMGRVNDPLAAN